MTGPAENTQPQQREHLNLPASEVQRQRDRYRAAIEQEGAALRELTELTLYDDVNDQPLLPCYWAFIGVAERLAAVLGVVE